jgi:enoyl-[acyl-carrier-protein] reductase (NADH)
MDGKRGLVMGVANDHSIAWGIAKMLSDHGAKLAFTYQGDALLKRVKPLAEQVGSSFLMPCDVEDIASVDGVFENIKKQWGTMDFLVHAVAFSDKSELKGRYADSTRENFIRTMVISCYAFTEAAKRAAALMPNGGAMVTLTYNGGERAMPNYNVMGVAKAGLEASVRYLAVDFGHQKIRGRHHRCPLHVCVSAEVFAARPRCDAGGTRWRRSLSAVRSVDRRHRRSAFRRQWLQRHRHAAARRTQASGRLGGERRVTFSAHARESRHPSLFRS